MKQVAVAIASIFVALALILAAGTLLGHPPREVLPLLVSGSVGSPFALRGTLSKAVPLLLTGLSVAIAFRAGVWNIGAEGQFLVGALAAFVAAPYGSVAAMLASMVAGAAWASIASAMRVWRNAPEVLTTILLNFTAIHILGWCVNGPLRERAGLYPQSDAVAAELPRLSGMHAGVLIAPAVAIGLYMLLYRTVTGLRLRATGANPFAARYAGIDVDRQVISAMAISGAVAGLAGSIELLGVTGRLFERFAAGYGYSGIAVALLAQLDPIAAIASALFFGALGTGAGELQRSAGISATAATLGQAIVILVLVASASLGRKRWAR